MIAIKECGNDGQARPLEDMPWPRKMRVLVLAPHPDDFDAIAVSLRFFRDRGDEIRLAVLSASSSGVQDSFCNRPTDVAKSAIREREQRESCRLFGLAGDRLSFLRLPEDEAGDLRNDEGNYSALGIHLHSCEPELVLMPHWNDPNPGHRRAFEMLRRHAGDSGSGFPVLLNRDPKTIRMRVDVYTGFREADARWKAALLRCHQSQQQRNLNIRGYGLDERILRDNRQAAVEAGCKTSFAEVFEMWSPR